MSDQNASDFMHLAEDTEAHHSHQAETVTIQEILLLGLKLVQENITKKK